MSSDLGAASLSGASLSPETTWLHLGCLGPTAPPPPTWQRCKGCHSAHILPVTGWLRELGKGTLLPSICASPLQGGKAGFGVVPGVRPVMPADLCVTPLGPCVALARFQPLCPGASRRLPRDLNRPFPLALVLQSSWCFPPQTAWLQDPTLHCTYLTVNVHVWASFGPWRHLERRENLLAVRSWFPEAQEEHGGRTESARAPSLGQVTGEELGSRHCPCYH